MLTQKEGEETQETTTEHLGQQMVGKWAKDKHMEKGGSIFVKS